MIKQLLLYILCTYLSSSVYANEFMNNKWENKERGIPSSTLTNDNDVLFKSEKQKYEVNKSVDIAQYVVGLDRFYLKIEGLKSNSRLRYTLKTNPDEWHDLIVLKGDGFYEISNPYVGKIDRLVFNNGDRAGEISFTLYRTNNLILLQKAIQKSIKLGQMQSPAQHKAQHLIGAIYYDGWSNISIYGEKNSPSQKLFQKQIKKRKTEDWREHVKIVYGSYPPKDCSFSMFYSDSLPNSYPDVPSRKPYWGWRRDSVHDLLEEIELAKKYGIDYFMFCLYPRGAISKDGHIHEAALWQGNCNNALYNFLSIADTVDFKFCVMIENTEVLNEKQLKSMMKFISEKCFTKSSYLQMNGAPVVGLYKWQSDDLRISNSLRMKNCKFISNMILENNDGRMWYAGFQNKEPFGFYPYKEMMEENQRGISGIVASTKNEILCIPVLAGWDNRARGDFLDGFNDQTARNYDEPTKDEFYQALTFAIDNSIYAMGEDKTILIYGWNEFGEGGYLPPTYGDTKTEPNDYPVMENGIQKTDKKGNKLYFDFYKLEAVKSAKEYWDSQLMPKRK